VQVADRWHLMENASRAFLDPVHKSMRQIRAAIGAATINPALLTAAEKLQYEGHLRREETNTAILAIAKEGATIKEIVRRTGYSRGLTRKVLRGQRSDIFRVRSSSLDPYLPWLDEQWTAGCRNGSELWRSLRRQGFRGCLRVVSEWSGRRRRSEKTDASAISRTPSARTVARLMTVGRDRLTKAKTITVTAIENGVELLVEARALPADFQAMIRSAGGTRSMDRARQDEPHRVIRERHHEGQSGSERRDLDRLVKRPREHENLTVKFVRMVQIAHSTSSSVTTSPAGHNVEWSVSGRSSLRTCREPQPRDLRDRLKAAGLPIWPMEELVAQATREATRPSLPPAEGRTLVELKYRDGTVIDTVPQVG
jgi:hypothetical protein